MTDEQQIAALPEEIRRAGRACSRSWKPSRGAPVDQGEGSAMRRSLLAAVLILMSCAASAGAGRFQTWTRSYLDLEAADQRPKRFEAYLRVHAADRLRREAALVWYSRRESDAAKLQQHTLAMVRYHPDDEQIRFANTGEFYADPHYRAAVLALLQRQVARGHREAGTYFNLGWVQEIASVPRWGSQPGDREAFLRYYELGMATPLPTRIDPKVADAAVASYRAAIRAAGTDVFNASLYSEVLANLLLRLKRPLEAVRVCSSVRRHRPAAADADLAVVYGRALAASDRPREAADALRRVRALDKEEDGAPGHATLEAETELGLIALAAGRDSEAETHLLNSLEVHVCCHTARFEYPLTLARRLLERGEQKVVIAYCERALSKFGLDGMDRTRELLREARASSARSTHPDRNDSRRTAAPPGAKMP
jgi:hypothetical protein